MHGNRRVWKWTPWQWRSQGDIRAMPPKGQSPGTSIYHNFLPSKPKPGLLDPLGPLVEVDFLSGFRAPQDGSGLVGRIRALQNEPGPRGMDPQDESGPRKTDRGSQEELGPRETNQGPQYELGPAGRIRAPRYG